MQIEQLLDELKHAKALLEDMSFSPEVGAYYSLRTLRKRAEAVEAAIRYIREHPE